jgi:hypothetical protein
MRIPQICRELKEKISAGSPGRNLYSVIGGYEELERFVKEFEGISERSWRMHIVSMNKDFLGYLESVSLLEKLIDFESKEKKHSVRNGLEKAFKNWITSLLTKYDTLVLYGFELLYAYDLSFEFLWEWAKEEKKVIFLIPGEKRGATVYIFPWNDKTRKVFPRSLLKEEWIWEIEEE